MNDPSWYMSSDLTNYVTSNLNNMFFKNEYKGKCKLIISNDQNLSISHIEAIIIDSNAQSKLLLFNNILHVPYITKNLLGISQFTEDNNVIVEFHPYFCLVKDENTCVLLQGRLEDGLYQFDHSKTLALQSLSSTRCKLSSCFLDSSQLYMYFYH